MTRTVLVSFCPEAHGHLDSAVMLVTIVQLCVLAGPHKPLELIPLLS